MALFSGRDGNVVFAGGYATKILDWTVDATAETVDTTSMGDSWRTSINGVKAWSGTYTAHLDSSVLSTAETLESSSVFGLGAAAGSATFNFDSDAGTATAGGFEGDIVITGASINAQVGDQSTRVTFTFQGTGELSTTTT
jgi:hypothetical protein